MSVRAAVVDRAAGVERSPRALAVLGVVLSSLLVGAVVMIIVTFRGAFTAYVPVEATVTGDNNAVSPGDLVVYRDVPVGTVASSGRIVGRGEVVVDLHIDPYRAVEIPANVTTAIEPVTIFGTEAVVLDPPTHPAPAHLRAGAVLASTTGVSGENVQGAVSSLDSILKALHPAQLDVALTAVATALSGQGKGLGDTLASLDHYLGTMLPHLPLLEADLGLLAPVANQVAASAPALVGSLSNLSVTARTLTGQSGQLRRLLAGGATVSDQFDGVLAPEQRAFEAILDAAGPLFQDISQSPTELSAVLAGLSQWATSWSAAERSGPYLSFSTSVPVANATDLVFAALDAPGTAGPDGLAAQALGTDHVDPTPYSSRAVPVDDASVRVDPALVTPAEADRAAVVASDLQGGAAVPSPAVAALYLGPVLSDMVLSS